MHFYTVHLLSFVVIVVAAVTWTFRDHQLFNSVTSLLQGMIADKQEVMQTMEQPSMEDKEHTGTPKSEPEGEEEVKELPPYEYTPLDFETQEMRFLTLLPGEEDDLLATSMSTQPLSKCEPYTYVINTRGNPLSWLGLPIDGHSKPVTRNIVTFLGHIRSNTTSQRLWFRDVCLNHLDPQEKSQYWNQEWMDTMIKNAEKVIDLSEVIAELWDKGELPKPFPPAPKDWASSREPKATKHHPAPLWMQKGYIDPPPLHEYLPLDYVLNEFRLVVLFAADSHDEPLKGLLAYSVMHDNVAYTCLSYSWGSRDEVPMYPLLLNGQTFMVLKNLDAALRELRQPGGMVNVWIDAISIDQTSYLEKNREIPRMLEIYEAADMVISWAGESDEASDIALDFLKEIQSPKLHTDDEGNWGPYTEKVGDEWKIKPIPDFPRRLAALYRFFQRPYFRRMWVIQELAAATLPNIFCGKKRVEWWHLDMAAYHLIDILHRSPTIAAEMMKADPTLTSVSDREIFFVRRLYYFRHLRSQNGGNLFGNSWNNIADTSPGILDALILGRDFESTSPHDKIFALLNLAEDISGLDFKPDYSKSLSETYQQFAIAVADTTESLDIICAPKPKSYSHDTKEDERENLDIPTWCPDWSRYTSTSALIRHEHIPNMHMSAVRDLSGPIYSACGPASLTPRFSFAGPILEVAGVILDTVVSVHHHGDEPPAQFVHEWLNAAAAGLSTEGSEGARSELRPGFMEEFWSMLAGDVSGVWGIESMLELKKDENGGEIPFHPALLKEDATRFMMRGTSADVYSIVTRGRALIITEGGLMGLVPEETKPGMQLAVLSKCSVPVVLEENVDGTYGLVGGAFVQGWMEGEELEEMGFDGEEAWEILDEAGRLKIV